MTVPTPVHDLGTNRAKSGDCAVGNRRHRVHNSRAAGNHPPAGRVVHRSDTRFIHSPTRGATWADERCPHNPQDLLLLLFFSLKFINKKKTGVASQQATSRPRPAETTLPRVPGSVRTPYGGGLRRKPSRLGTRVRTARCSVWKGQS